MIQTLRLLLRRRAPVRQPTASFYARCIPLGDDGSTARITLPTPPWWKEVTDEERPEFQHRFDEFYQAHPELVQFQPNRPGTKEYEKLQEAIVRGFSHVSNHEQT
jgi:hypothetical protein